MSCPRSAGCRVCSRSRIRPARTNRAGLREDALPVGAEVTVFGERNEDPERNEAKVRRVIWDGREFDVYPPK